MLPWWWRAAGAQRLRQCCPTFHFKIVKTSRREQLYPCTQATWLSLSDRDLYRLVSYLYEGVGDVSPADEAARLALLASPTHPAWSGG